MKEEPEIIIKVKELFVVYDKGTPAEARALNGISIEIPAEEFVVIFGPSGCGKSTLLYAMAGIEKNISSGEIWIKNKNLVKMTPKEIVNLHRKEIGMIFQAYNLIPTLSVLDNISLPLLASGINKKIREKKALFLLSRFGVAQFVKRFPQFLSGGQQQRVAIARALISDPDIIFADEPTGNLDSSSAEIVMKALTDLNRDDRKTIVLVTHDPSYLVYAHRVIHIKDGKMVRVEVRKKLERLEKKDKTYTPVILEEKEEEKFTMEQVTVEIPVVKKPILLEKKPILLLLAGEDKHTKIKIGIDKEKEAGQKEEKHKQRLINTKAMELYFDWHFNSEEENRLSIILRERILGMINKDELFELLDIPFKDGGMGFYQQKALRLSDEIEEIVNLFNSLKTYKKEGKNLEMKAVHIAEWLLRDYGGIITPLNQERVEDGVVSRLNGVYNRDELKEFLDRPISEGGAGLYWQTARKLALKLDTILG